MRSVTTRFFIVLSALLIGAIIAVQVYWLNRTYRYEQHEFDNAVLKVIRGVYEDLPLLYDNSLPLDKLVEKYKPNGALFEVHVLPEKDSLQKYLATELEDFRVFTDCKVALYDKVRAAPLYQFYLSTDASTKGENHRDTLPVLKRNFNYVHLYFPNRSKYIISEMRNWIYASIVLLVLLTGFSFFLYYFYKQKFLVEVQKDFINNVTHEFSTPLSVIELAIDGLQKHGANISPERTEKYSASIRHQLNYLKSHLDNLMRSIQAGHYRSSLNEGPASPVELLKKAVLQLEPLLEKKNGHVEWGHLDTNCILQADEQNLYLAFFNIISNAIKYSDTPVIKINTAVATNRFYIHIRDNGMGIDVAEQKKIFRKFYRVKQGNLQVAKGLGLGLYFTKNVILGHGGSIRVDSKPGMGSDFIIELPLT